MEWGQEEEEGLRGDGMRRRGEEGKKNAAAHSFQTFNAVTWCEDGVGLRYGVWVGR